MDRPIISILRSVCISSLANDMSMHISCVAQLLVKALKDTSNKVHRILLRVPVEHGINHFDLPHQTAGGDDGSIGKEDGLYQFLEALSNSMMAMTINERGAVQEESHDGGTI